MSNLTKNMDKLNHDIEISKTELYILNQVNKSIKNKYIKNKISELEDSIAVKETLLTDRFNTL